MSGGKRYALGLDFGTSSARALIVDLDEGKEIASQVAAYPTGAHGVHGSPADPNLARQNPADYVYALHEAVRGALASAAEDPAFAPGRIAGIGVDTTGSTPIPVDSKCRPLATLPEFAGDLDAMAWLWKDHTSHAEAAEITSLADEMGLPYLGRCGGAYSSEWFWAKVLRCARIAPRVFDAAASWLEFADYIPAYLTGAQNPRDVRRGVCSAGHKAMWDASWGGLPSQAFLERLDPRLAALRPRLYETTYTADQQAGGLAPEIAIGLGIPAGIPVAVGAMDAHLGAVGAGVAPGVLVKIMGTSACDILVAHNAAGMAEIPGVCGQVDGSVIPGMIGIEAGQSAVGDLFAWVADRLCPAEYAPGDRHANLAREAQKLRPGESGLLALDWNNGNRTVLVDPHLTGLLVGQTLQTTAPEIYRAMIEATAFGARAIVRRLEEYGAAVRTIVCCGGIAEKSPLVMQIYADVLGRPMKLSGSAQTCALGAAIMGAVAGGIFPGVEAAQARLTGLGGAEYRPKPRAQAIYAQLFDLYMKLHDAFGVFGADEELFDVMKRLIEIRGAVRGTVS